MGTFQKRRAEIVEAGVKKNLAREAELIALIQQPDENAELRRSALVALRRMGSTKARPIFIQILINEHSNKNLRESAIKALGVTGEHSDLEILWGLAQSETIARFGRQAAMNAYKALKERLSSGDDEVSRSKIADAESERYDVFVCHASEDKPEVVEPLVVALRKKKISTWYDRHELRWGDSLISKINQGLSISKFVIVVLSKAFLRKNWPKLELESALNIEASTGRVVVLPLLVGSPDEQRQILHELPILNHKLYVSWDGDPINIVTQLENRLD